MKHPSRNTLRIICYAALVLLLLLAFLSVHFTDKEKTQTMVTIEMVTADELWIDGYKMVTQNADTTYATGTWVNLLPFIPSCRGRIMTAIKDSTYLNHNTIEQIKDSLSVLSRNLNNEDNELKYYLSVHNVQDEAYNNIASLAQEIAQQAGSLRAALAALQQASPTKVAYRHQVSYQVLHQGQRIACHYEGKGRLRTADKTLPRGCKAVSRLPLLGKSNGMLRAAFYPCQRVCRNFTQPEVHPIILHNGQATLPDEYLPSGSPLFNAWGLFCGMVKAPRLLQKGFFGHKDGMATLCTNGAIVYAGQFKKGRRQGTGFTKDSIRRAIIGTWRADTLTYGKRKDSIGLYTGYFNRNLKAEGHGKYIAKSGMRYEGLWKNDKREGFGYGVIPGDYFRVGEWRDDIYRGERLTYTTERIYGIDLSKYQHEIGKKKYPIQWSKLRIRHLGTLSKKRVNGKVDYPISFVYIKATEGVTITNKYFHKDYQQAHRHGLKVGAYHFFSTKSSAYSQAVHFLRQARFSKGDFPPVLDVEPSKSQINKMGGPEVMWQGIKAWLRVVEKQTGTKPILYISQYFVNHYLPLAPDIKENYHIWIARYGEYKPDIRLAIWQLSPDGRVQGIRGKVDINVFNGYKDQYEKFVDTATIP